MAEIDDEGLEGLADLFSNLKPSQKKKLERLVSARAKGIKKTKRVQKISLGSEDLIVGEEEENTRMAKDGSIVHSHVTNKGLYDCNHAITPDNFGHKAECGHTVCKACAERYALVCSYEGCMRKLCAKKGCYLRVVDGVNFCIEHGKGAKVYMFLRNIGLVK